MQVLIVTYTVLTVNFFVAVRPNVNRVLIEAFRNYGIVLFLIPLGWTVVSMYYIGRQEPPPRAAPIAFWSWMVITLLLLVSDVLLIVHASGVSGILKV
ncbi:MAG: hypothetical protein P4L99_25400 [Chthoniobacter sp.]|nr:hypothetical protein [Chthoniobacter sp.]